MNIQIDTSRPGYRLIQRYCCMMGYDEDLGIQMLLIQHLKKEAQTNGNMQTLQRHRPGAEPH
jgi:hypothetical protein